MNYWKVLANSQEILGGAKYVIHNQNRIHTGENLNLVEEQLVSREFYSEFKRIQEIYVKIMLNKIIDMSLLNNYFCGKHFDSKYEDFNQI